MDPKERKKVLRLTPACDTFVLLATAAAREDDVRHPHGDDDRREHAKDLYATLTKLPAGRFPVIVTYASQMVAGTGHERFRFVVDAALDGMLGRSSSSGNAHR